MWRQFRFKGLNKKVDGLLIRLANKDDAALISHYFIKNRLYLREWEPRREPEFFTESGWKSKLNKLTELHLHGLGFYCLIIDESSGAMLGTVSFSNLMRFPLHSCSVGYSLDEDMQGKGIMRKALATACEWMFEDQNIHRITASYMPRNKKSAAVLEASGFEEVGYAKDYLLIDGRWEDHCLTALINHNWKEKVDGK